MGLKSKIFLYLERFLSFCTDKIVCISESELESAKTKNIATSGKLELIPNGIDINSVRNSKPKLRSDIGLAEDAFVVGMIGRLSPQKAPDIFIKSAKLIIEKIPKSQFIIVGSGEMEEQIITFANSNNLTLKITGWTDEPFSFLKCFDVALLLSRWEGFGLAVVEYMAAEKNVVATRIDALPTLIDDGIDGLLVDVDSPEDVCEKVLWLYEHPDEAEKMRENALKKVYAKFDIQRVANQHIQMFTDLLRDNPNFK